MKHWALALGVCLSMIALPSAAQITLEQLQKAELKTEKVGDGLYVICCVGGNVVASVGADGVLIVDTGQFAELVPRYLAAIRAVGGRKVDIAINTHFHVDHVEGNRVLGLTGTTLIAQANTRDILAHDRTVNTVVRAPTSYPPFPTEGLPMITFKDSMQLNFNGETIDLMYTGPAHTAGDAAIIFRNHNAAALGDVLNTAGYPFLDTENGGDLDGAIKFCETVLGDLRPGAVVIPGHGPVTTYEGLKEYIAMLKGVRAKLAALIKKGATMEEVMAAKPTAEWDARWGNPMRIINRGYLSLTRKR
jgi:glyoxylase-like metal-dependent hydrolase (beta-lactamase superfamily II)